MNSVSLLIAISIASFTRIKAECAADKNEHCPYWESTGECENNPGYMNYNCKLSCCVNDCCYGNHLIALGSGGGKVMCEYDKSVSNTQDISSSNELEKIALQCCFDSGDLEGQAERDRDSLGNEVVCMHALNFVEATDECANRGGRLCTLAEVTANTGQGTGCSHDNRRVWTSDTCADTSIEFDYIGGEVQYSGDPNFQWANDNKIITLSCADATWTAVSCIVPAEEDNSRIESMLGMDPQGRGHCIFSRYCCWTNKVIQMVCIRNKGSISVVSGQEHRIGSADTAPIIDPRPNYKFFYEQYKFEIFVVFVAYIHVLIAAITFGKCSRKKNEYKKVAVLDESDLETET